MSAAGLLSLYLNDPLPYVRNHITGNKNVLSVSFNKTFSFLPKTQTWLFSLELKCLRIGPIRHFVDVSHLHPVVCEWVKAVKGRATDGNADFAHASVCRVEHDVVLHQDPPPHFTRGLRPRDFHSGCRDKFKGHFVYTSSGCCKNNK